MSVSLFYVKIVNYKIDKQNILEKKVLHLKVFFSDV